MRTWIVCSDRQTRVVSRLRFITHSTGALGDYPYLPPCPTIQQRMSSTGAKKEAKPSEEAVARHAHDWHRETGGGADANADGRTTRSEAKKANVDLSDPRDLNDDGKVTRSEAHAVENARARSCHDISCMLLVLVPHSSSLQVRGALFGACW